MVFPLNFPRVPISYVKSFPYDLLVKNALELRRQNFVNIRNASVGDIFIGENTSFGNKAGELFGSRGRSRGEEEAVSLENFPGNEQFYFAKKKEAAAQSKEGQKDKGVQKAAKTSAKAKGNAGKANIGSGGKDAKGGGKASACKEDKKKDPCGKSKTPPAPPKPLVPKIKKFMVYRYNPEAPEVKPFLQSYDVDLNQISSSTTLDCLQYIKNNLDSTLTFRRSCREGICGSCGMNIEGVNRLACIHPFSKSGVTKVYPLPHMYVVKDLVVDMTHFMKQYAFIEPFLQRKPMCEIDKHGNRKAFFQMEDEWKKFIGLYECVLCACCSTSCPSYWWNPDKFLGPASLLHAYRWIIDSRDQCHQERMEKLKGYFTTFRCHNIMNCAVACPKKLNPGQTISRLKKLLANVSSKPLPKTAADIKPLPTPKAKKKKSVKDICKELKQKKDEVPCPPYKKPGEPPKSDPCNPIVAHLKPCPPKPKIVEKKKDPCDIDLLKKKKDPCKTAPPPVHPCKEAGKKLDENAWKKLETCEKKESSKKDDPCNIKIDLSKKKEDPCKKKEDPCKKKEDPCKKKEDPCKSTKSDPCKGNKPFSTKANDSCKKEDPCKQKEDPCKKKEDPCKEMEDPCKKKEDPCKKKEDPCKKKEEPCNIKIDLSKKREDPCKKKEDPCKSSKSDPCNGKKPFSTKANDSCKKDDPCKKKEDPCKKKEDPCKKKEDPCKSSKKDPCKMNSKAYSTKSSKSSQSTKGSKSSSKPSKGSNDCIKSSRSEADKFCEELAKGGKAKIEICKYLSGSLEKKDNCQIANPFTKKKDDPCKIKEQKMLPAEAADSKKDMKDPCNILAAGGEAKVNPCKYLSTAMEKNKNKVVKKKVIKKTDDCKQGGKRKFSTKSGKEKPVDPCKSNRGNFDKNVEETQANPCDIKKKKMTEKERRCEILRKKYSPKCN